MMHRSIGIVLGCSMALAACSSATSSPLTAVPSETSLATSTTDSRPTRTAAAPTIEAPTETATSPTADPTPWWGATPAQPVEAYTLTTWTAADTLEWAAKDLSPYPANRRGVTYDDYDTGTFVSMTLYREALIQDPDSANATTARQALANPETYGWGSRTPLEPFREAFERTLNAHEVQTVTTATVTSILAEVTGQETLRVQRLLPIDNVMGNGESGWVVDIRSTVSGAVLAITRDSGAYRVLRMRPTWTTIAWNDYEVAAVDLNANGVSEVAIWDRYWGTGMSHFCDETYAAYEWQTTSFANLTAEVSSRALTDYGDCLPVESEPTAAGPMTLTTGNIVYTGCSSDSDWATAALVYQRRYGWNGRFFELADATLLPFPDLKPGDMNLAACALSWANQAGPEVPQARALMERLLDTTDPTLIEAFTAQFGPAYHDFFTFKLGTWYAQIGQSSKARTLLTAVRDAPRTPQYTQASQLAAAFLKEDAAHGAYAACVATHGLIDIRAFPTSGDFLYAAYDVEAMRAAWGFSDSDWATGGGGFWDDPALRKDRLNLCNPQSALRLGLETQVFTSASQVAAYLTRQSVPFDGLQEADVDGDGRRDWILLAGTGEAQSLELWVLLNRQDGVQAEWVGGTADKDFHTPTTVASWVVTPEIGALTVYQWSTDVAVLRAIQVGSTTRMMNWMNAREFAGLMTPQIGFAIRPHALVAAESVLIVRQSGQYVYSPDELTIGWDPSAQSLASVDQDGGVARTTLSEAEHLLFVERDVPAAAALLDTLLAEPDGLPVMILPMDKQLATFEPYVLYLRGLTAELSDQPDEAVQAYWTLWNRYPTHPFSAIVQRKLFQLEEQP